MLNNILLAAATTTVLLGTLYPLIREAMTGEAISVGPPYFNLTFTPLMAALAILLPAGPLLAWKRGDAAGRGPAAVDRGPRRARRRPRSPTPLVSPRKAFGAAGIGMGVVADRRRGRRARRAHARCSASPPARACAAWWACRAGPGG